MIERALLMHQSRKVYSKGLVLGVNAYGRLNSDADRDILKDYSGNGRDIRLYNFAFSGMSRDWCRSEGYEYKLTEQ